MNTPDLILALLLPLPPWLGFLIYRYRGRVGLAYGYFLGGVLAVLSLPWPQLGTYGLPSAHLGGTLFGFTLFLQAHREGRQGLRSLTLGVSGATFFVWILGNLMGLDMRSVTAFWATALLEGALWLVLSDLGYRVTRGRWLALRMPLAGGAAFLVATALYRFLPLGVAPLSWLASLLAGVLLGLVALQQLVWMRAQGIWVEGRGNGFRVALSALEGDQPPEGPALAYVIEARQPMILVNEKGTLLETNTAFSRLVGLPRHQMMGYRVQDLFQGREASAWEELRDQLLKDSRGSAQATLVHRDASFQPVRLEAVPFDRNMALVWIVDAQPGTLALRGDDVDSVVHTMANEDSRRATAEALGSILPAVEQILGETWNLRTRNAAERIILAAQRLMPDTTAHTLALTFPQLRARPALDTLIIRIQQMFGEGFLAAHRTPELTLFIDQETLQRMVTQVMLHGRQLLTGGTITAAFTPVTLGTRSWARLDLELAGPGARGGLECLGLSWLQQAVREALGMLELTVDEQGRLWPRIYIPCKSLQVDPASTSLQGQHIWIFDEDAEVRTTLCNLVREAGGEAVDFADLRALVAGTRTSRPDLLVLERTPAVERLYHRLRGTRANPLPLLILGDGRPLPAGEEAPRRLILLEKPFPGQNFLQCLLALLQKP